MANNLNGGTFGAMSPTYWSKRMGRKLYKTDQFRSLANFEEQPTLKDGQRVDRPYRSDVVVESYTKGTALTAQDLTATDDTLTVDYIKAALIYVDNVDKIQNKYSAVNEWTDELGKRLSNALDARFFLEVFNANSTVDDGSVGGTAGNALTPTTSTILGVFGAINLALDVQNVEADDRYFAISPQFYNVLWQYIAGKVTMLGDKTGQNGNIGQFAGLSLFKSNNLTGSAQWVPANNPSNNDTITIQAVTFTFVTSIGTAAGNILIAGSTALTLTNLYNLLVADGVGDAVNNVSLSLANQRIVQDWTAVNGTTYIEVRVPGASYLTVTGSDATDVWTGAQQTQNLMAGRFRAVDVVVQKEPSMEMGPTVAVGKSGTNVIAMTLAGFKTFFQGKNELVKIRLRTDAY